MSGFHFDNALGRISHDNVPRESMVIYDPLAASDAGNVYTTLAGAVAAIAAMQGPRSLLLPEGNLTWPTGTQDLYGVTLIGNPNGTILTIGDGVTWTRMPSGIVKMSSVRFTNTLGPIYSGDGSFFDLTLDTGTVSSSTGTAVPIVINDPLSANYAVIRLYGWSEMRKIGGISVIRMENAANVYVVLNDGAALEGGWWPFENDGLGFSSLYLDRFGTSTQYTPLDINLGGWESPYPPVSGYIGIFGTQNDDDIVKQADGTYGNANPESPGCGFVPTPDPEWLVTQWHHPIITRVPMMQEGRIFPQGITGNDLLMDGVLTGLTLTKGAVTTSLPAGVPNAVIATMQTAAVVGAEEGWITPLIGNRRSNLRAFFWFKFGNSVAGLRFFIGLTTNLTRANNTASDNPAATGMAGLQFSTGRPDTYVQFMVQNNGVQTLVPNVNVTPSTSQHYALEVVTSDGTVGARVYMRLYRLSSQGLSGAGAWQMTTNYPSRDTQLALVASLTSLDGAVKTFGTMGVIMANGPFK